MNYSQMQKDNYIDNIIKDYRIINHYNDFNIGELYMFGYNCVRYMSSDVYFRIFAAFTKYVYKPMIYVEYLHTIMNSCIYKFLHGSEIIYLFLPKNKPGIPLSIYKYSEEVTNKLISIQLYLSS